MTIAHRFRVPIDSNRRIVVELPEEFDGTEAEVIVLAERARPAGTDPKSSQVTDTPPDGPSDFLAWLEDTAQTFREVPAIPLEALRRETLYGHDE